MERESRFDYFMRIAYDVSRRSTCLRRSVGAVLVNANFEIIGTGYNGAPRGAPHCEVTGCVRQNLSIPSGTELALCRALHGEQNAIMQARGHGIETKNSVLYVTTFPCVTCTKMIIQCGIKKIYHAEPYFDSALSQQMLSESKVEVEQKDFDPK